VKIKYLPTFFCQRAVHGTMGQMGQHGPNKGMTCRAWAEPPTHGPAWYDPICYPGRVGPSSQARA
jgi:hypothetical protein